MSIVIGSMILCVIGTFILMWICSMLMDMVISMEHVAAQAKEYGHSNRRELAYLVVHSVLHLLGYDHLDEGPQKKQMRGREEAILAELGINRED